MDCCNPMGADVFQARQALDVKKYKTTLERCGQPSPAYQYESSAPVAVFAGSRHAHLCALSWPVQITEPCRNCIHRWWSPS